MMLSEAIEAVGKMISGYANGGASAGKSYIGTMASLLCQYPRSIATHCADPVRGVARETKFIPTVADVVEWCEPHMERMTRIVDFDDRTAQQLRTRAQLEHDEKEESPEYRRQVIARLWPRALDGAKPRTIVETKPFRQFSADDLKAIYAPREETP